MLQVDLTFILCILNLEVHNFFVEVASDVVPSLGCTNGFAKSCQIYFGRKVLLCSMTIILKQNKVHGHINFQHFLLKEL